MPYGGTTKAQDKKIESCVEDKMKDKDFKSYKDQTKKRSAIAVCKAAIVGKK